MQLASNDSKAIPPRPPRQFYRRRLLETLDNSRNARVILLVGQAGQGKSTLAVCYAQSHGKLKAWLNMDRSDEDPIGFMVALIGAVKSRAPDLDFQRLESNLAAYTKAEQKAFLFSSWARLFWETAPARGLMVFDALEKISFESETFHLIKALIDFAPPQMGFLFACRKQPPLKLQKLKLAGQALVIDNRQLAFTLSETEAFFRGSYNLDLERQTAGRIQAVTEGWISGVIVFAQWLAKSPSESRRKLFREKLEWHLAQELYAFFGEEVFLSLDKELQHFLIKTAFLETLEPACIDAILETGNAAQLLDRLAAETFFIQPHLSEKGDLFYRYHQLFQRYLLHKLDTEIHVRVRRQLASRAADYYLQGGRPEASLPFYIQAKRYEKAEQAVAMIGMQLVKRGQLARLEDYLERIPETDRRRLPWMLLYHSVTIRPRAGDLALEQLYHCLGLFAAAGDYHGQLLALAFLIETSLLLGYSTTPIDDLIAKALELLNNPPQQVLPLVQAQLWLQLGYATIRGVGDFSTGLEACRTAHLIGQKEGNLEVCAYALALMKIVEIYLGHFAEARQIDAQLVQLLPGCSEELRTLHISTDCVLHIYQGHGDKALAALERLEKTIEAFGFRHFHTWLMIYKCLLYPRIGKAREAEMILQAWLKTCQAGSFSRAMALLFLGFSAYYQSAVVEGIGYLEEAAEIFSQGPLRSRFQHMAAVKALGIGAYLLGNYAEAEKRFLQALEYAKDIGSDSLLADVYLFQGLNSYAAGRKDRAANCFRAGFKITTQRQYSHFVVIHEDDLACACLQALVLEAVEDPSWVIELLVRSRNYAVERELSQLVRFAAKNSQIEKAFQALSRARLGKMRVYTLGRFAVELDGRPLEQSRWKGQANIRFFQVLLARGSRDVFWEILAEDLWPESRAQTAANNFKSALRRLRMVFEPQYDSGRYYYLLLRRARLGLDPELCWIDAEAFQQAAAGALEAGSLDTALEHGKKVLELYQGDFLPDELYADWAAEARQSYKKSYLEVLEHLSRLCLEHQEHETARDYLEAWLRADPYSNSACRALMDLWVNLGQKQKALMLYKEFAARHRKDLEMEPDPATSRLYRLIQS